MIPQALWSVPLASSTPPSVLSVGDIQIGDFSLIQTGYIVNKINHDDLGQVDYETFNRPRTDGGGVLGRFYRGHKIQIDLTIVGTSDIVLQQRIDALKLGISRLESYLYMETPTDTRRILGTVTSMDFGREHYNITFLKCKITFTTVEPFFQGITGGSLSRIADTANYIDNFSHTGTAQALPVVYFNFGTTTATGMTMTANGFTITVLSAITTGDIIIIDSNKKSVTKNSVWVDYSGVFPTFSPGGNPISVTVTGTFALDTTITAPKTYL